MNDPISPSATYIGDGVYTSHHANNSIVLETQQYGGKHWIELEPQVFEALLQFAIEIGWLKKGDTIK